MRSPQIVSERGTPHPWRRAKSSCRVQLLVLCAAAAAAVGSNMRRTLDLIDEPRGGPSLSASASSASAAADRRPNRKANGYVIDLTTSSTNASASPLRDSFFDCDRVGARCRYLRPGKFYRNYLENVAKRNNASDGEGRGEWRRRIGLENKNLPALDSLSWWMEGDDAIENYSATRPSSYDLLRGRLRLPRNVTYVHVHKCGGTSIQSAMYRRARRIRRTRVRTGEDDDLLPRLRAYVRTYKHSFGGGSAEKKLRWDGERTGHVRAVAERQRREGPSSSHPIFTVVRDPIRRFLSAIQQVMHYNAGFRSECLIEPPWSQFSPLSSEKKREERERRCRRDTVRCAIRHMEETDYGRDVHLLPMASHFRLLDDVAHRASDGRSGRDDVVVSVFPMEEIRGLLLHLGNEGDGGEEGSDAANSSRYAIHARDRSDVGYATSPVLARLSPEDCDGEMMRRICDLYDVDVELMRWLGLGGEAVERCGKG